MVRDDRPVLLGMSNPYDRRPQLALYPVPSASSGGRLCAMMLAVDPDVTRAAYIRAFDRRNLLTGTWSDAAAEEAGRWARQALMGRIVVVLGRRVWDALDLPRQHPDVLPWCDRHDTTWRRLPHPSGMNRWYNSAENRLVAGLLLRELIYERGE